MEVLVGVEANDALQDGENLLLSMLGSIGNARPLALEFLTVPDLMQLPLVSKQVRRHLSHVEYHRSRDGQIYPVPYPGFPGLLPTKQQPNSATANKHVDGLFPHQLASLQAMHTAENSNTDFGALRGGIMGDAPGLGKTITSLALISQTSGIRPQTPKIFWDEKDIQRGWIALAHSPYFEQEMLKALKPLRVFRKFSLIQKEVNAANRINKFPTIKAFEDFVRSTLKEYSRDGEMGLFFQNMLKIKAGLNKSNRKLFHSEAGRRLIWEIYLTPSSATIVIVPDALREHWVQQIQQHLDLRVFHHNQESSSDKQGTIPRGLVYVDGSGDIADARMPLGPIRGTQAIVPANILSSYMIVITSFSRCESEFQREVQAGRMKNVMKANTSSKKRRRRTGNDSSKYDDDNDPSVIQSSNTSPLLQIRWLRVVVDEGHELGTYEGGDGMTRFINRLAAERRWVLSGTPTTGDETSPTFISHALDQLQRLLLFLRHPKYGALPQPSVSEVASPYVYNERKRRPTSIEQKEKAKTKWEEELKGPFLQKAPEGRARLLELLREVMVMHKKEDIHLPKPIFVQGEKEIPIPEGIQQSIRSDPSNGPAILHHYLYSDGFQSLVDQAQAEYICDTIQDAKNALQARGGPLDDASTRVTKFLSSEEANEATEDVLKKDRRPIKAVVYSSNKNNLRDVTEGLYARLSDESIAEAYDDTGADCSSELSRFRHNRKDVRECPLCKFQNDYSPSKQPKCERFLMEVTKYGDDETRFMIEPERIVRTVPLAEGGNVHHRAYLGETPYNYGINRRRWTMEDLIEIDIRDPHPLLAKRLPGSVWEEYGASQCRMLAESERYLGRSWYFGPLPSVPEAENRSTMYVRLKKWQKCGAFHNPSTWYKGPKLNDSPIETVRENVDLLSLDAGLAHGLDLSFLTHIFLCEPIEDAALLEQITSRAHRLGASGPVSVITVNVNYKLSPDTEKIVEMSLKKHQDPGLASNGTNSLQKRRKDNASLTKVVCCFCYRSFDSYAEAESHEATACPRNPENATLLDPWHLSTVYSEIKPPSPLLTGLEQKSSNSLRGDVTK